MTVTTDLVAARDLIDTPGKWAKGIDYRGCTMCAMWAVAKVTNPNGYTYSPRWDAASKALTAAIPRKAELFISGHPVVAFNDADDTTHADVMALFDRAIALSASQMETA